MNSVPYFNMSLNTALNRKKLFLYQNKSIYGRLSKRLSIKVSQQNTKKYLRKSSFLFSIQDKLLKFSAMRNKQLKMHQPIGSTNSKHLSSFLSIEMNSSIGCITTWNKKRFFNVIINHPMHWFSPWHNRHSRYSIVLWLN